MTAAPPPLPLAKRIALAFAIAWGMGVTLARSVQWPNDWAEAQWMIGYQAGFIKRGLPGAAFRTLRGWLGEGADAESMLRWIGAGGLGLASLVLLGLLISAIHRSRYAKDALLFALLMCTSAYLVMSAHVTGYYDQMGVVIAWLAMLCVVNERVWAAGAILGIGMLCHETLLVLGIPSVLFAALLMHWKAPARGMRWKQLFKKYAPMYLIPAFVFLAMIAHHSFVMDTLETRKKLTIEFGGYKWIENGMYKQVPWAITYPFKGYIEAQSPHFVERLLSRENWIQVGLPLIVGLVFCLRALRGFSRAGWAFGFLVAFTFLPLALHLIAWDVSRIWTYPVLPVWFGFWAIHRVHDTCGSMTTPWWLALPCAGLIGMQMIQHTELMNEKVERYSEWMRLGLYLPVVLALLWVLWPGHTSAGGDSSTD